MFYVGILLGIYSYLVFFLGIVGRLSPVFLLTSLTVPVIGLTSLGFLDRENIFNFLKKDIFLLNKFQPAIVFLLFVQIVTCLIGAFSPEIGFDALWYHLTIPKIFLNNHSIFFIQGNLFYYSLFPKLTEMLYMVPLAVWDERGAKLIHFFFGLLTLYALYKFSRMFLDKTKSLLTLTIFYSNLVIGWESTSSYVDLSRAFYETASFYFLFLFFEKKKNGYLIKSALLLGFAVSVKILSLGSLGIAQILILTNKNKNYVRNIIIYSVFALIIPLPWFIFSYLKSGNPFYPIFSGYSNYGVEYFSVQQTVTDLFSLFLRSADPLTPVYVIFLPLAIIYFTKYKKTEKRLIYYVILAIIIWCVTPRTGGSRFFVPYLPVLSIAILLPLKYIKDKIILNTCISVVVVTVLISIFYRGAASIKYIPFILQQETKQDFLLKHLNFSFGDFIDENDEVKKIVKDKNVLLYGFHNLYYIDFPFIDSSYVKKGDRFSFILTQNVSIPSRFKNAQMVYSNSKTFIKLYKVFDSTW